MKTAAVILAAGQGTRMKSTLPKVLHLAAGRPLVAYPLQAAREMGCEPLVVVVGHQAGAVESAVTARFPDARLALQEKQSGTADAVRCAQQAVGEADRVLILYGDCPLLRAETLKVLFDRVDAARAPLGMLTAVVDDPTGYGRLVRGADGRPLRNVEHKDCSDAERAIREVNAGVYLVDRAFLFDALSRVTSNNAQRELYLPDVVELAAQRSEVVVVQVPAEEILGVNSRLELAEVERVLQDRLRKSAMLGGVTLRHPESTFLDADVSLSEDVTLGPGVQLRGKTRLGRGVRVEGPTILVDATVEEGADIRAFSHVEGARVGRDAVVGPFARLRPETVLEEQVHVGNFVEVKKATLRKGAKANHLTYLGDAEVGEKSNVGAGTITCNYDGYGKYRTEIGAGVFVGSDSVLVAPLKIGEGAYVAAGSVVTDEVPPGALAVGRARQVVKPGRAEQLREKAKQKAGK
ncbi:MAG: bifunctional UDP-N-acetylglucosamine diphosphorylase/glucosamine-1-phosphate N-acetyltransferase GlmU [Myxococcota bacterium]